ncbi:hypothetical protein LX32DRAFT_95706 [Colletotrichum zoysiae]|uniref:Uncharacterized protein n=1 Tax=Colletotrichum zoysiae TaxID=1216348 RepID=A0AAD9H9C8_9PEZI|nr:hypothetical protein LX32DRAFT_95706 [Colletotrichum zoysiae]
MRFPLACFMTPPIYPSHTQWPHPPFLPMLVARFSHQSNRKPQRQQRMRPQSNLEPAGCRSSVVLTKRDMSRSSLIGSPRSASGTLHCMRDIPRLPELELVTKSYSRVSSSLTIVWLCVIAADLACPKAMSSILTGWLLKDSGLRHVVPCLRIMHCLQNAAISLAQYLYRSRTTDISTSARGLSVIRFHHHRPTWLRVYPVYGAML